MVAEIAVVKVVNSYGWSCALRQVTHQKLLSRDSLIDLGAVRRQSLESVDLAAHPPEGSLKQCPLVDQLNA